MPPVIRTRVIAGRPSNGNILRHRPSAREHEESQRHCDSQGEGRRLGHLVACRKLLKVCKVECEVGDGVYEGRDSGDLHQPPLKHNCCEDQQDGERKVQTSHVSHEVHVIRGKGQDPRAATAREVIVKGLRRKQRPYPDHYSCRRQQD